MQASLKVLIEDEDKNIVNLSIYGYENVFNGKYDRLGE